jgi:hypothetical protein
LAAAGCGAGPTFRGGAAAGGALRAWLGAADAAFAAGLRAGAGCFFTDFDVLRTAAAAALRLVSVFFAPAAFFALFGAVFARFTGFELCFAISQVPPRGTTLQNVYLDLAKVNRPPGTNSRIGGRKTSRISR